MSDSCYKLFFIPVKMTSDPKDVKWVSKKMHQNAIETKNVSGWGGSGRGGWECHNVDVQHPQNRGVLKFWKSVDEGVGGQFLVCSFCGDHEHMSPCHSFYYSTNNTEVKRNDNVKWILNLTTPAVRLRNSG